MKVPPMIIVLPTCQIESTSPSITFGVKLAGLSVGSCAVSVAADTVVAAGMAMRPNAIKAMVTVLAIVRRNDIGISFCRVAMRGSPAADLSVGPKNGQFHSRIRAFREAGSRTALRRSLRRDPRDGTWSERPIDQTQGHVGLDHALVVARVVGEPLCGHGPVHLEDDQFRLRLHGQLASQPDRRRTRVVLRRRRALASPAHLPPDVERLHVNVC